MNIEPAAFFVRDGDLFIATAHSRGPWSEHHAHGGPPAALLGGTIQRAARARDPSSRVVRITLELQRPVPLKALRVTHELLRPGRKTQLWSAMLFDGDTLLVRATALTLRTQPSQPTEPQLQPTLLAPAQSRAFEFDFFSTSVGYHTAMELRLAHGNIGEPMVGGWLRARVPLVEGEPLTGLERALIAVDAQSGVAHCLDVNRFTFLNPDLTLYLSREPEGEWIGLDATGIAASDGTGIAQALVHDEHGVVGRSIQSLLVEER